MKRRVITGVLGASLFLITLLIGGWVYSGFVFLLATLAFLEYSHMQSLNWRKPHILLSLLIMWSILINGLTNQQIIPPLPFLQEPNNLLVGMIVLFILILLSGNRIDIHHMSYLFVGALYIGYGFSYMLQTIWKTNGLAFTLFIILVTWANDSGAYFIGKYFGQKKLWPAISPNKTFEGSIAGIGSGVLFGIILTFIFPTLGSFTTMVCLALLITVVGQVGDLIESSWKRSIGVKDSGTILPGHGGILDRFDSLLFSFIILHLLHLI